MSTDDALNTIARAIWARARAASDDLTLPVAQRAAIVACMEDVRQRIEWSNRVVSGGQAHVDST